MSLYITSLNSGSNGNCYYIGNDTEAVFIDAGLSCRETEKRMKRLGLDMDKVKAIFISHEHGDHIHGLPVIARKYKLPVYITTPTLYNSGFLSEGYETISFAGYQPVTIGGLKITAFPKQHDAADPFSFIISGNGVTVGVFTDIGVVCEHVANNFRECHAVFLEANYDESMLEQGRYPVHLKRRIRNGKGHLSNNQALDLFLEHRQPFLSYLLLSHLSANNNRPEIVHELFTASAGSTNIVIASRFKETPVYHVAGHVSNVQATPVLHYSAPAVQASLF
jgi:phosphoribosyl 1,2-cyclic phosphodiesterase